MNSERVLISMRIVMRAIREKRALEEVMDLILESACQIAGAVHGSFIRVEAPVRGLKVVSTTGPDWTEEKLNCRLSMDQGITGRVARSGMAILCGNVRENPDYFPLFEYVQSELAVPVVVNNGVWGIINLDGLRENAFTGQDLTTLSLFAEMAASAITLRLEIVSQQEMQKELLHHEKMASIGQVAASIAHEINNPLTAIMGHASLLSFRNQDPDLALSVNTIEREAARTASLVKRLLSFSRKETLHIANESLSDLVDEVFERAAPRAKERSVMLESLVDTELQIPVDRELLGQVIENLITNAIQAIPTTSEEGVVRVSTWMQKKSSVCLRVEDNGMGMSEEVRARIFEPFFSTKPVGNGTGLGLSIAKNIMEQHGGSISVLHSGIPGTIFELEFPLVRGQVEFPLVRGQVEMQMPSLPVWEDEIEDFNEQTSRPEKSPFRSAMPISERPKILIIDDEHEILEALAGYFESFDISVTASPDGFHARDELRVNRFDAIICDVRMAGLSGLQLYDFAVLFDSENRQKFMFMTGDYMNPDVRGAIQRSGRPFLEKPFTLTRLRGAVFNLLGLSVATA